MGEGGPKRVLDLFCGAGGAAMGLHRAWPEAEIVGIDIKRQPRYPFKFLLGDALQLAQEFVESFDFAWASPTCQAHVSLRWMYNAKKHENLISPTRDMLTQAKIPFVIENVPQAPLRADLILCGTMFELGIEGAELRRHRWFECEGFDTNFGELVCNHKQEPRVIGVYGGHGRDRRRKVNGQDFPVAHRREAMGIDWMTGNELSQAIPPAYSEYIAKQFDAARAAARD